MVSPRPAGIVGHQPDRSEQRFWKLYREERAKFGKPNAVLSSAQIVHCARTARARMGQ